MSSTFDLTFDLDSLEALMLGRASAETTDAWKRSAPASLMHTINMRPATMPPPTGDSVLTRATSAVLPAPPKPALGPCLVCGSEEMLLPCTLVPGIPCRHVFCGSCLSQWIATQVQARNRVVICPAVGCAHPLNQADIARLSKDPAVPETHTALMAEVYGPRLREMEADPVLKAWIDENARACPKCSLLITRAAGCNSVACTCGHRFCYCCLKESCERAPTTQPQANAFHALLGQQAEIWKKAQEVVDAAPSPALAALLVASQGILLP